MMIAVWFQEFVKTLAMYKNLPGCLFAVRLAIERTPAQSPIQGTHCTQKPFLYGKMLKNRDRWWSQVRMVRRKQPEPRNCQALNEEMGEAVFFSNYNFIFLPLGGSH